MGWGSDIVPTNQLLAAALRIVVEENQTQAYAANRSRWSQPVAMDPTELAFLAATAKARIVEETKGHMPAPLAALETMLAGQALVAEQALVLEAQAIASLFGTPTNRALVNVFFLTDYNKRTAAKFAAAATNEIKSLGVIGAGIMGAGIAAAAVKNSVPTTMIDANASALEQGTKNVLEDVAYDKLTKKSDPQRALRFAPLLHTSASDEDLRGCDLIVEAVTENFDLKKQIHSRLEQKISAETILASNTSSIPISKLAATVNSPERFCGIHFFNPVRRMKLVEVVRGKQTSDATVNSVVAFTRRLG
jgi:hypothetical protein